MKPSLFQKIRNLVLPPVSPQELALRTLYHRVRATRIVSNRQQRLARASYQEWLRIQDELHSPVHQSPETYARVTFLLAIDSCEEDAALATINSLQRMVNGNWKVLPILYTSDNWSKTALLPSDDRVMQPLAFNELSSALPSNNDCEFFVICAAGDVFNRYLLGYFQAALNGSPQADVYYYDCEHMSNDRLQSIPFFKPSGNSPELMISFNYLSRGFLRAVHINEIKQEVEQGTHLLVSEHDLMFKLLESGKSLCHVPYVLARQAPLNERVKFSINERIKDNFISKGFRNARVDEINDERHLELRSPDASVSIIILNRNHGVWLKKLVNSIFSRTDYPAYSLIIVDNQSTESEVLAYYEELKNESRVTIVHYDSEFNYSEAINIGVANANTDVVVLMNNDMQVTEPNWLRELAAWAINPEIGVVGGKLLHRNRSIQHAGIILGMNGFIGHLYLNAPEHYHGLAGSVDWYRNFYALTGACQAMRRELFHQVGGYDERFRLAFGDIDFCLRVSLAGYRNLYNPHAVLIHYEGGSRGYETPLKDIQLGYKELDQWLMKDDPFFSPNLSYTTIPRCHPGVNALDQRLQSIEDRKQVINATLKME